MPNVDSDSLPVRVVGILDVRFSVVATLKKKDDGKDNLTLCIPHGESLAVLLKDGATIMLEIRLETEAEADRKRRMPAAKEAPR